MQLASGKAATELLAELEKQAVIFLTEPPTQIIAIGDDLTSRSMDAFFELMDTQLTEVITEAFGDCDYDSISLKPDHVAVEETEEWIEI